jgi:hypothetical protein
MDDTKIESQDRPPPPAEVKTEETPAETKEPEVAEVAEGDAPTPAVEPDAAPTPTPAPATGISKQVVDIIEGVVHRLVSYQNDEWVF